MIYQIIIDEVKIFIGELVCISSWINQIKYSVSTIHNSVVAYLPFKPYFKRIEQQQSFSYSEIKYE